MRKPNNARLLATEILSRSTCLVQVGAAIEDSEGILAWGWNGQGAGYGIHAEEHAIQRANKRRLYGSKIYVASKWRHNGKVTPAKPCERCQRLVTKWGLKVSWRDKLGNWNAI